MSLVRSKEPVFELRGGQMQSDIIKPIGESAAVAAETVAGLAALRINQPAGQELVVGCGQAGSAEDQAETRCEKKSVAHR